MIIRWIIPIIFLGTILVLGGCGTAGKKFDGSKVKNIANGITTQAEIKIMFGKPFKAGIQNGQTAWVYEHNRYHLINDSASKDLIVIFGPNGIVQSHQYMTSEPNP